MILYHNKLSGITIEEMPQGMVIHQDKENDETHTIVISANSDAKFVIQSLQKMIDYGILDLDLLDMNRGENG